MKFIKKIFSDMRSFFNEEPLYAYFFVASILLMSIFRISSAYEVPEPSLAMEKIKTAQILFSQKGEDAAQITSFVQANPEIAYFLGIFTVIFFLFLCLGFVVSLYIVFSLISGRKFFKRVNDFIGVSWGLRDVAKVIILFVFISFVTGLILSLINGWIFHQQADNYFMIVHTLIVDLSALSAILYFVKSKHGHSLEEIGLLKKGYVKDVVLGVLGYSLALPIFIGIVLCLNYVIEFFQYNPPPHPLIDIFISEDNKNPRLVAVSILLACTIGPFIEEVFFRGFCYRAIRKVWGVRAAMIVTAAFFALIHNSLVSIVPIFFLGLILAWLYEKRGSLVPSITLHVLHNSLFIGYFFILKSVFLDRAP